MVSAQASARKPYLSSRDRARLERGRRRARGGSFASRDGGDGDRARRARVPSLVASGTSQRRRATPRAGANRDRARIASRARRPRRIRPTTGGAFTPPLPSRSPRPPRRPPAILDWHPPQFFPPAHTPRSSHPGDGIVGGQQVPQARRPRRHRSRQVCRVFPAGVSVHRQPPRQRHGRRHPGRGFRGQGHPARHRPGRRAAAVAGRPRGARPGIQQAGRGGPGGPRHRQRGRRRIPRHHPGGARSRHGSRGAQLGPDAGAVIARDQRRGDAAARRPRRRRLVRRLRNRRRRGRARRWVVFRPGRRLSRRRGFRHRRLRQLHPGQAKGRGEGDRL